MGGSETQRKLDSQTPGELCWPLRAAQGPGQGKGNILLLEDSPALSRCKANFPQVLAIHHPLTPRPHPPMSRLQPASDLGMTREADTAKQEEMLPKQSIIKLCGLLVSKPWRIYAKMNFDGMLPNQGERNLILNQTEFVDKPGLPGDSGICALAPAAENHSNF